MNEMPTRQADPDAWRAVLGATDIVAVLGLSPYRSPLQVWLDKRGDLPEDNPTPAMRRGLLLEPSVERFYEEATGNTLCPVHPFRVGVLAASPDRQTLTDKRFVELKTHTPWVRQQYGAEWSSDVPAHVAAQVTAQVAVARRCRHLEAANADIHHVAAFFGDEFAVFEVIYDPILGEDMLRRAEAWWERHMIGNEPPEVGASEADADWIARMYPAPRIEDAVQATAEVEALISDYRQACLDYKEVEARRNALQNRLKLAIGDAAQLHSSAGTFTYRVVHTAERIDAIALREQFPDIAAQVTKPGTPYRRLTPPKGWIE